MSLNGYEFKPFILILGILLFIGLTLPLLVVYSCLYLKHSLISSWNDIKKKNKYSKYNGIKGV